jgi:hypothetical protein
VHGAALLVGIESPLGEAAAASPVEPACVWGLMLMGAKRGGDEGQEQFAGTGLRRCQPVRSPNFESIVEEEEEEEEGVVLIVLCDADLDVDGVCIWLTCVCALPVADNPTSRRPHSLTWLPL